MFGVRRRRGSNQECFEPTILVSLDPAIGVGFDDDHVAGFDGVFVVAVADESGP